jgi:hypothetical protein
VATDIENIGSSGADFTDSYSMIGAGAINVKTHFGAVGDGVTNDTAAIQAAFDAVVRTEDSVHTIRGGIYFPPGEYLITSTIVLAADGDNPNQYQGHIFAHPRTARIKGNFAGYLFDNPNPTPGPQPAGTNTDCQSLLFEGLTLYNASTDAAAGCIRIEHTYGPGVTIRDCHITGHRGIILTRGVVDQAAIDSVVSACHFQSLGNEASFDTGSIGLGLGANCRAHDCSFQGWHTAVALYGGQASIYDTRIEVGYTGILVGQDIQGDAAACAEHFIRKQSL